MTQKTMEWEKDLRNHLAHIMQLYPKEMELIIDTFRQALSSQQTKDRAEMIKRLPKERNVCSRSQYLCKCCIAPRNYNQAISDILALLSKGEA